MNAQENKETQVNTPLIHITENNMSSSPISSVP